MNHTKETSEDNSDAFGKPIQQKKKTYAFELFFKFKSFTWEIFSLFKSNLALPSVSRVVHCSLKAHSGAETFYSQN